MKFEGARAFKESPLVFKKKESPERYQARFWCDPELYKKFVAEVESNDLGISNVFGQFMSWFVDASERGVLPVRPEPDEDLSLT